MLCKLCVRHPSDISCLGLCLAASGLSLGSRSALGVGKPATGAVLPGSESGIPPCGCSRGTCVCMGVCVPVSALKSCSRPASGAKRSQLMGERQELGLPEGTLRVLLVPAPSRQHLAVSALRYQTCSWLLPIGAGTRPRWLTLPPFFAGVCPHHRERDVGDAKHGAGCESQSGPSCGDNNLCQTELWQ